MKHVVIIGNGISGVTTARHIRKYDAKIKITIISSETKYFFSRTALMYVYMGHMKWENIKPYEDDFWKKNRIDLLFSHVNAINFEEKTLSLSCEETLAYDDLVLAVGSKPNKFGWPGQDLKGVQGLYSYNDLELMEENTRSISKAVIVGGGLIGVEMAEMLLSRGIEVDFLVREDRFWGNVLPKEEGLLIQKHIESHGVNLKLNTNLVEILSDETGRAKGVTTDKGEVIDCQFVGLTAGVGPNIEFLKESQLETERGIKVNEFLETNISNVYAIGDCAQFITPPPGRRNMEQVWYTGRMMGETVAKTITGVRTKYQPGHWFNSAKFFDVEYQTYGWVMSQVLEGQNQFYWEHPTKPIGVKIIFNQTTNEFIGINVFGIRLRHERFDRWLTEKRSVEYILEHFNDANFDPEFFKNYGEDIISKYNTDFNKKLTLKKKKWARIFS